MNKPAVKKWKTRYISVPSSHGVFAKISVVVRSDGEVIQKKIERTIYDTPYETPLAEWTEQLNKASEGLIEPAITVRSYDGGEHHGYYESPSSETIISGWVEELSELEMKLAQEMYQ